MAFSPIWIARRSPPIANGRWVEAERKLKETPTLLKLPSGYLKHNPWLTIADAESGKGAMAHR